jgi:hypothetical protein
MQRALANQRMGLRGLEVRAMPKLLSSGPDHLERAILSPAPLDQLAASIGRDALSLRCLPLQFRELPVVQRKVFLEEAGSGGGRKSGNPSSEIA